MSRCSRSSYKARLKKLRCLVALSLAAVLCGTAARAETNQPDFRVIFDSNRSGSFGIYIMNGDGSAAERVIDTPAHEMYPDPSPDGRWVVYAVMQGLFETSRGDIWIKSLAGGAARRLAANGSFPTFSSDGQYVYFERQRDALMRVKAAGGRAKQIFPRRNNRDWGCHVIKPRVSSDGRYAAFVSECGGAWSTWYAKLSSQRAVYIGQGCEPGWFSGQRKAAWIDSVGTASGTGIYAFDLRRRKSSELHDAGSPWGVEYFPSISRDDRYLLFGACPDTGDRSHVSANFQIFVKDLESKRLRRLSNNGATDRWPKLIPAAALPDPSPTPAEE